MRPLTLIAGCCLLTTAAQGNAITNDTLLVEDRINIMVVNPVRDFDIYSKTLFVRARVKSLFSKKKFHVVKARSSEEMLRKVTAVLRKHKALLGTLWFDSHGYYKNGYSSFSIGQEEFSYRTIRDSAKTEHLSRLAPYCDSLTNVVIGSCFGGATYHRRVFDDTVCSRMNGDSLMIALSGILNRSTTYGSESWVMMKPGVFQKGYAFAGRPPGKKLKHEVFAPAWLRLGAWNRYSASRQTIERIPTLSFDKHANVHINRKPFIKGSLKKRLAKKVGKFSRESVVWSRERGACNL